MVIKKVLVAVDGSEGAGKALDFALDLAEKFGASVMILNVSESLVIGSVPKEAVAYSGGNAAAVPGRDLEMDHDEILSRSVAHAKTVKPNLSVSSMLKEGDPATEIVDVAKEDGFDVVVVGNKGFGLVKELLLGSVSEKVAPLSPCPVIIVK